MGPVRVSMWVRVCGERPFWVFAGGGQELGQGEEWVPGSIQFEASRMLLD